VTCTACGDPGEQDGESKGDERHPPVKAGMPHEPGDGEEEGKGKANRSGDDEGLSLPSAGEAEFLMRLGDVLGCSHELELVIGNVEGVSLVEITSTNAFAEPAHALL